MVHSINGWSNGGRRPLTYNLMPGQFRNTRTHIFQNQTIINNNVNYCNHGSYQYYDDCGCSNQKMGWFDWTMLGGMGLNLLGNMFSLFGGGGGADKTQTPALDQNAKKSLDNDLAAIKKQYPDANLSALSDGTILCNGDKYASIDGVLDALKTPTKKESETSQKPTVTPEAEKSLMDTFGITKTPDGKYKVGDQEYNNLPDAANAANAAKAALQKPAANEQVLYAAGTEGITAENQDSKFKVDTGANPYKAGDNFNKITVTALVDTGNPSPIKESFTISKGTDGKYTLTPSTYKGKPVSVEELSGGYLRLKVNNQTYIIGESENNSQKVFNGYQYKQGNVEGWNNALLRGGKFTSDN